MVWPNAGLGIAISALDISESFRHVARSTRNELKVNFRLYKNLLTDHFYSHPLVPLCSQLTPWFAEIARCNVGDRTISAVVRVELASR
jgi:hypothetical protein